MAKFYKFITILIFTFFFLSNSKAEILFLDFNYVISQSEAGKKVNSNLKNQLDQGIKKLKEEEKKLQNEEKKIIQQKKILSGEDYKAKIVSLRKKVTKLQNDRDKLLDSVSKKRKIARDKLLANLNPIMKEYMQQNNIKIVLDKKSILLADEKLDITMSILNLLNKKIKSINLN